MKNFFLVTALAVFMGLLPLSGQGGMTAAEIIRKADDNFRGEKSSIMEMTMTIVRPTWERSVSFRTWTLGSDYALTLITAPAKEKGQTFLKRQNEMWSWNPSISRMIKLPPSMMSQGWMGSDYTNDDILRESSLTRDYHHDLLREEVLDGHPCYVIRLTANDDGDVVWGQQLRWVDREHFLFLKAELYDEDGYLVRTEKASDIRMMDGRMITTLLELIPAEDPGNKTVIRIESIDFNPPIEESFFSIQNMKKVR
ncbi:MAG: outer membrane lipoprotein-sorting protein [Bacteroidota bacterium]